MAHPNVMIDDGKFFIMRGRSRDQETVGGGLYVRRGFQKHILIGQYGLRTSGEWYARIAENLEGAAKNKFTEIALEGEMKRNDAIHALWAMRRLLNLAVVEPAEKKQAGNLLWSMRKVMELALVMPPQDKNSIG